MFRRLLSLLFFSLTVVAFWQCARRGTPSGGPKDVTPPRLLRAEPPNLTLHFSEEKIRLYFDELIQLKDVQNQLIVSPPLKYQPIITPQGGANKFVEIKIKDTLRPNTTYTLNFGQSIVDNNEGNPNSFFTYVFSTGDYIDSLQLQGAVRDAFNRKVDQFVSVMLYEIDSTYTDSTVYERPPNYITNTLDSAVIFTLKNLKAGKYALFALKDAAKNHVFDQNADKIGFLTDTVEIPTDSTYALTLFKEIPDYKPTVPSYAARNRISFGYYGNGDSMKIRPITTLPDSVRTYILPEQGKDTLNYWLTPTDLDSIIFTVTQEKLGVRDTFTVKKRKVGLDSMQLSFNQKGNLDLHDPLFLFTNTPLTAIDSSRMALTDQDTLAVDFHVALDTAKNQVDIAFEVAPNQKYRLDLLPGAITDFFGTTNDTLIYRATTKSLADYGNLTLNLDGAVPYPLIVQLTNEKGETQREIKATEPHPFAFDHLNPGNYLVRVVFDTNGNGIWDTGSYLKKIQPERVSYYPKVIEMRANWEQVETFTLAE